MADVKWIKITTDIFDDEKILLIESMPDAYAIITVWFKLLCLAGKMNNDGVFVMNDRIAYTDIMLATIFRMKETVVSLAIKTFQEFGMVDIIDGVITIPNWNKHQSLDSYEKKKEQDRIRQARRRDQQRAIAEKSSDSSVTSRDSSRDQSRDVAVSEEEREEDKEYSLSSIGEKIKVPSMSKDEVKDLLGRMPKESFNRYCQIIVDCENSGRHFRKSHYQAILDMYDEDAKRRKNASRAKKPGYNAVKHDSHMSDMDRETIRQMLEGDEI